MARKEMLHILRDSAQPGRGSAAAADDAADLRIGAQPGRGSHPHLCLRPGARSPESRDLIQRISAARATFRFVERGARLPSDRQGHGHARGPARRRDSGGFRQEIWHRARAAQVQLLLDGSDSNTAAIAMGYAEGVVQTYAQRLTRSRFRCRVPAAWFTATVDTATCASGTTPIWSLGQFHRAGADRGDPDDHRGESRVR